MVQYRSKIHVSILMLFAGALLPFQQFISSNPSTANVWTSIFRTNVFARGKITFLFLRLILCLPPECESTCARIFYSHIPIWCITRLQQLQDYKNYKITAITRLQQLQDYSNYRITPITRITRLQQLQDYSNCKITRITTITRITRLQQLQDYYNYKITAIARLQELERLQDYSVWIIIVIAGCSETWGHYLLLAHCRKLSILHIFALIH